MKNKNLYFTKMKSDFTIIPNMSLEIPISSYSFHLFILLVSLPEDFRPSIVFLSRAAGMSKNTVQKCMKELISRNMISVESKGFFGRTDPSKNKITVYSFVDPKKWKLTLETDLAKTGE